MKIVHIVTSDYTGAGLCAKRICKAQRDLGLDAILLVKEKTSNDNYIIQYPSSFLSFVKKNWIKVLRKLHLYQMNRELNFAHLMTQYKFWGSLPVSSYRLDKSSLIRKADIIHLHYIDDFIDYPSFFRLINKKIIWTQHDESINFGISHYTNAYNNLPEKIKRLDCYYYKLKQNALTQAKDLMLVSLSEMMYNFNRSHSFTQNMPDTIIHNSVDYNIYKPIDKEKAREFFNISKHCIILLFAAADISDKRKGLRDLVKAAAKINNPNIKICTIGLNNRKVDDIKGLIRLGTIKDPQIMSYAYSAADYFIMPSFQEAFAQTPLEAMACGKPVIAYPCSGTKELINKNNGIVCKDFTVDSLVDAIIEAMHINYNSKDIRKFIINNYSPEKIAQQYLSLYIKMLQNKKNH